MLRNVSLNVVSIAMSQAICVFERDVDIYRRVVCSWVRLVSCLKTSNSELQVACADCAVTSTRCPGTTWLLKTAKWCWTRKFSDRLGAWAERTRVADRRNQWCSHPRVPEKVPGSESACASHSGSACLPRVTKSWTRSTSSSQYNT